MQLKLDIYIMLVSLLPVLNAVDGVKAFKVGYLQNKSSPLYRQDYEVKR